jgi:hypothetical protein
VNLLSQLLLRRCGHGKIALCPRFGERRITSPSLKRTGANDKPARGGEQPAPRDFEKTSNSPPRQSYGRRIPRRAALPVEEEQSPYLSRPNVWEDQDHD